MRVRYLRSACLVLFLAGSLFIPVHAFSQASAAEGARPEQNAPASASPKPEDSSEQETDQFKHSASVRWISHKTGLSTGHAYWLAVVLNFLVVVSLVPWVLKLILGNNLPTLFRSRTASIQKSIEEARRASEDANQRLAQIESRLGRLDDEIAQMRATSEKEAAVEEERIKASAVEDAQRIVESAEQEIAAAAKAASRELTSYAADLAVTLATKQIHVDTNTDQALVRRFANQLSNDVGKKA